MKREIRVFMTEGLIDTVPSLREVLLALHAQGHPITLVMPKDSRYSDFCSSNPHIKRIDIPQRRGSGKFNRFLSLWGWVQSARKLPPILGCVSIGIDAEGLMMAECNAKRCHGPLVYYSLEIACVSDKPTLGNRFVKLLERRSHRRASLTVIQDPHRGALLESENSLSGYPTLYIPNAPLGKAAVRRSDYIRKRLGINPAQRIVLHAGSIASWANSLELATAALKWSDPFILVFQCRQRPVDEYGKKVVEMADSRKLWIMSEPVPAEKLPEVIQSCEVGVALYSPLSNHQIGGKNVAVMGKASGKVANYLMQGVPVVLSRHESMNYVETHSAGCLISQVGDIEAALEKIEKSYQNYCSNAVQCFETEFDVRSSIERFSKYLL